MGPETRDTSPRQGGSGYWLQAAVPALAWCGCTGLTGPTTGKSWSLANWAGLDWQAGRLAVSRGNRCGTTGKAERPLLRHQHRTQYNVPAPAALICLSYSAWQPNCHFVLLFLDQATGRLPSSQVGNLAANTVNRNHYHRHLDPTIPQSTTIQQPCT